MELSGKTVIITGGGSGLGYATAQYLSGLGANVHLLDINQGVLEQAVQSLQGATYNCVDVCDEQQVQAVFEQLKQNAVILAGVVNCAGIAPAEKILGKEGAIHQLATFQRALNVNVVGTFNLIRYASQMMAEQQPSADGDRGVIINTASVAAFDGQIGQTAYSASKGAVVAMTLPLARELSHNAIRVMTIAPGIMETPMLQNMPENVKASLGEMVPYPKRLGKTQEFAKLVAHIFENNYLNGEVIRLDGAIRMAAK